MKFEIKDTVNHIEHLITIGNNEFIVDSDFGKLFIEINTEDYGPEISTIIEEWTASPSEYTPNKIKCHVDYYVCIANPTSNLNLHLKVIEAIYRVMFYKLLRVKVSDDIIDAAILIHRYEQEGRTLTVNALTNDFCKNNLSIFSRNDSMVRYLVRSNFERRITIAKNILRESASVFDYEIAFRSSWIHNCNNYYRQIIGLMIYAGRLNGINLTNAISVNHYNYNYI